MYNYCRDSFHTVVGITPAIHNNRYPDRWYSDHDLSRYSMRSHTRITQKKQAETYWTRPHHHVAVYYLFLAPCLYPLFGLCLFCRHFDVHQLDTSSCYGLTAPPANSNPVPSNSASYLSACLFSFHICFFHQVTWYFFVGTKYSTWYIVVINVVGHYFWCNIALV